MSLVDHDSVERIINNLVDHLINYYNSVNDITASSFLASTNQQLDDFMDLLLNIKG